MPFITALFVIGLAELGDKTQLLTFGFATKYPLWEVLSAVFCASALLMGVAVIFGGVLNQLIPPFYLQLLAGLLFIGFGLWTLFGREEDEEGGGARDGRNPFWIVFTGFLLAELGDKTQLATLGLAARYGAPLQVWLGATMAMAAVNTLSVILGGWIKKYIPDLWLKLLGAAVFIIFGLTTLGELFIW